MKSVYGQMKVNPRTLLGGGPNARMAVPHWSWWAIVEAFTVPSMKGVAAVGGYGSDDPRVGGAEGTKDGLE